MSPPKHSATEQHRSKFSGEMKKQKLDLYSWIIFPLVLVILGVCLIFTLVLMIGHAHDAMHDVFDDAHRVLATRVQDRAHLLMKANDSVFDIARILSTTSNKTLSSYYAIDSKVAPRLFMAFITIPWVSQISYFGFDGLILAYYHEGDQTRSVFSNTTHSSNDSAAYRWYSQPVNMNNGELDGNVIVMDPSQFNDSKWFYDALNGKSGYTTWGSGFGKAREPMFFFTARVAKIGVVSLGISVNDFIEYVSSIDLHGGDLYLATKDGHILSQTGPQHASYVVNNDTITVYVMDQNDIIEMKEFVNVPCQVDSYTDVTTTPSISNILNIWGTRYKFSCAPLDAAGIQLVSMMAFPGNSIIYLLQKLKIILVLLLSVLILGLIVGSYILSQLYGGLQVQEQFLRTNLIKHKEAIQQAERKSMNKSLAFARASHDLRTSLAGIIGLIELCRDDVPPNSELDRNLVQMNVCASKLLGILNSVLDTSKVEAGKMQLEEAEFDMAQVLEESVDIFHVVALKKGLEVIWDPCDCSVLRSLNVKGDCKRFKQILDNLLGNAVKFTSEGHVVVRAWCKKRSSENSKISLKRGCLLNLFYPMSKYIWKDEDSFTDLDALNHIQNDPSSIEFIFEVDDSGMGIPKENKASVFENYVQVNESIRGGHEGTGLGLGIVQSFVRLMGGEINIQDKSDGERGTCFRFNIFLKSDDMSSNGAEREDPNPHNIQVLSQLYVQTPSTSNVELTGEPAKIQSRLRALAFRKGLEIEGIHSLLFVQGDVTKRIIQRWMISLGVEVREIRHLEHLSSTLESIKNNLNASERFDHAQPSIFLNRTSSRNSNIMEEGFASSKDETSPSLPFTTIDISKKMNFKGLPAYILIIIDFSCGNFSEICAILENFAKNIHNIRYKVVWLNTSGVDLASNKQVPCDLILQKPFHGSRLYAVLSLLQEFGGTNDGPSCDIVIENAVQGAQQSTKPSSSLVIDKVFARPNLNTPERNPYIFNENNGKPLSGINILLVEDTPFLRNLALAMLSRLGATVQSAENGSQALDLVKDALRETIYAKDRSARKQEVLENFRYNVILMDCEMPEMNGYDATRHIRAEEKSYGHHIPIIALTAHATPEEERKTLLSGMDFHLTKPLQTNKLVEVIRNICQN